MLFRSVSQSRYLSTTGGQAKIMIVNGEVKVNDMIETRRGRKLLVDDIVTVTGKTFKVGDIIS